PPSRRGPWLRSPVGPIERIPIRARSAPGGIRAGPPRARGPSSRESPSPDRRSRLHLPLQVVVLEVLERKLDILDQRCRDLSHIQEGFVGRLERPEPLQYFISHLKYRTRFARHFETSLHGNRTANFSCKFR